MKIMMASLVALSLAVGSAGPASAASHKKKGHYAGSHERGYIERKDRSDGSTGGYYEHRLEAVPFGSRRWWDIQEEQAGDRG